MPLPTLPRVGEVWNVDFDPQVGREQSGVRPALVISFDRYNDWPNGLHIIVPITTRNRQLPIHLGINPPEGGLTRASFAMCDQVKAQSVERFVFRRGTVSESVLRSIQRMVATFVER